MSFFMTDLINNSRTVTEYYILIIIILASLLAWKRWKSNTNIPPGPRCLPLVGYLPYLGDRIHVTFNQLAKKHGDIFSLYIGRRLVIVLNSYDVIKEAFIKQADIFAGRLETELVKKGEAPTIFVTEGETWKDYKRFTLKTLRDFGFGKLSLEPRIKEEVIELLKAIEDFNGKPVDVGDLFRMSVSNIICTLIRGKRFEYKDESFQFLIDALSKHFENAMQVDFRVFFPELKIIPGLHKLFGFTSTETTRVILTEYIKKALAPRIKAHQQGEADDYVNAWLTEAKNRGPENAKNFTNDHLVKMVFSLFAAGTDTTANSLRWSLIYLMANPHVQARVQKEIDDVIGHERMPSLTDRDQMPYTEATMMEIQRITTIVPLAIPHCNTQETTLRGYRIPKRTVILPNLWAVHFDPKTFPEPNKFLPERFLSQEGKLIKTEQLIPFSIGKRECLGESLAKMEFFIYFASLFQKFTFTKPEGSSLSFDCLKGVVSIPHSFKIVAEVRNKAKYN